MMGLEDQQIDVSDDLSEFDDADLESDPNDTFDGFDLVSNIAGLQSDLRDSHDLVAAATSLDQLEDYRENLMEKDEVSDDDMNNYQSMAEMAVGGNDPVEVGFMPVTENYGSNKMALEAIGARNAVALESIHKQLEGIGASIKKRLRRLSFYFKAQWYKIQSLKKDLDKADFPTEGVSINLKVTNDLRYGDHSECKTMDEYIKQFDIFVDFANKATGELTAYGKELTEKLKDSKKIFFKSNNATDDKKLIVDMIKDFHKSMLKLPTMHKANSGGSDRYWEVFVSQTFIGEIYAEYRTALGDSHMGSEEDNSKIRSAVSKTTLNMKVVNSAVEKNTVRFEHVSKADIHKSLDMYARFWSDQNKHLENINKLQDYWLDTSANMLPDSLGAGGVIRDARKNLNTRLFITDHMRMEVIGCAIQLYSRGDRQIDKGISMNKKIIWSA